MHNHFDCLLIRPCYSNLVSFPVWPFKGYFEIAVHSPPLLQFRLPITLWQNLLAPKRNQLNFKISWFHYQFGFPLWCKRIRGIIASDASASSQISSSTLSEVASSVSDVRNGTLVVTVGAEFSHPEDHQSHCWEERQIDNRPKHTTYSNV